MSTTSFWLISAPADPSKQETISKLRDKITAKQADLAAVYAFALPEFKIGTLDALYVLSDELAKLDPSVESIATKIADNMKTLLNNDMQQWRNSLVVNEKSVEQYLNSFQWNALKYRADKSLKELADAIVLEANGIDTLMKNKMQSYSQIKTQMTTYLRKQTGNLAVKSLNGVVKKEFFVLDSEYLTTLLVAVPKAIEADWVNNYETLTQMVVPRSSQKIAEDDEYALMNVTLFQRVVEEFSQKCRERKFVVRDFTWDEKAMAQEREEALRVGAAEKEQWTALLRLCKTNFGEVFQCVMHLKSLRVYVESILRYGLPPNFQPMILRFSGKNERKLKELLNAHYAKLAGGSDAPADKQIDDQMATILGEKDYTPCVFFSVSAPQ